MTSESYFLPGSAESDVLTRLMYNRGIKVKPLLSSSGERFLLPGLVSLAFVLSFTVPLGEMKQRGRFQHARLPSGYHNLSIVIMFDELQIGQKTPLRLSPHYLSPLTNGLTTSKFGLRHPNYVLIVIFKYYLTTIKVFMEKI